MEGRTSENIRRQGMGMPMAIFGLVVAQCSHETPRDISATFYAQESCGVSCRARDGGNSEYKAAEPHCAGDPGGVVDVVPVEAARDDAGDKGGLTQIS